MSFSITSKEPPAIEFDQAALVLRSKLLRRVASEPGRFAAQELRRYLEQILGVSLPEKSAPSQPRIVVEQSDDQDLGDEGFEISGEANTLRIRGGGPAGAVYGVYEFPRRSAGCQFSGLGPSIGQLVSD